MISMLSIVGTRPQFVKAAALSRAILDADDLSEKIIHTGQHYDDNMSDDFFVDLEIPKPAWNLSIAGGTHGQMTGRMLEKLDEILLEERPDIVIVFGDTNSTLAAAIAAAKLNIPVAHVEAGLRSSKRKMPEETNRIVVDNLSSLILCPTYLSVKNLELEGIKEGVVHVGDVMLDATLFSSKLAKEKSSIMADMDLEANNFALATVHRAENTNDGNKLREVMSYLSKIAGEMTVVMPLHPRTRAALQREDLEPAGVTLIDPIGYLDMHRLLSEASIVLTDSGGLQKEAYFHSTPCVTLRDETEWVETIESGWNRLWKSEAYKPRTKITEYGKGAAAQACLQEVRRFKG